MIDDKNERERCAAGLQIEGDYADDYGVLLAAFQHAKRKEALYKEALTSIANDVDVGCYEECTCEAVAREALLKDI